MIKDCKKEAVDFIVFCGDIEGRPPSGLVNSPVPILYVHGDHDFFYQWSEGMTHGWIPEKGLDVGGHHCPVAFILGNNTEWQSRVGPYFWSMTYKGIHFIFDMNQKFLVYGSRWYLKWLERDLKEHEGISTVMFTHRPPTENSPTFEKIRKIIRSNDNLISIIYAHVHAPRPFTLLGKALLISVELDKSPVHPDRWGQVGFEGNSKDEQWYGFIEIKRNGVNVYARYLKNHRNELRYHYSIRTTFRNSKTISVNYPFILGNGSTNTINLSSIRNPKLRCWGIETEELLPDPLFKSDRIYWSPANDRIKLSIRDCKFKGKNIKLPARCLFLRPVRKVRDSHAKEACMSKLAKIELRHISTVNKVYHFLMIVRQSSQDLALMAEAYDRSNRLLIRSASICPRPNNGVSFCTLMIGSSSYEITPGLHSPKGWIWIPTGERLYKPMNASRIELYIATSGSSLRGPACVNVFCFPQEGWLSGLEQGRHATKEAVININSRQIFVGNVREGQCIDLGRLPSKRTSINLNIKGSELAIIEFTGVLNSKPHKF